MSELSEDWKLYKEYKREQRENQSEKRFEYALNEISKIENVEIMSYNNFNYQIVVLKKNTNEKFVFYAYTGKITNHNKRGIKNLLRLLRN